VSNEVTGGVLAAELFGFVVAFDFFPQVFVCIAVAV